MIIKLLPEQVVKFWDMLRFAIAETFMPRGTCTNEHLRFILAGLLSGKQQCWMAFKLVDDERKFIGFIVTRLGEDQAIGEKTLFLDSVYAFQSVPDEIMADAQVVLNKFAAKNNCMHIVSLTESEKVMHLAQRNGYKARFYLYKEVTHG